MWIGCIRCEKSRRDFVARTFPLIAPDHRVLHRVSCSYEMIPNAPKDYEGPMGWIGCVRCEKSRCHFEARTFTLIAPVQLILHRVSSSNETIQNAPKYYELHRNISLGSKGVDWVRSLKKSKRGIVARNFALIAPVQYVLQQVSCSYKTIPNAPKHYEMHKNMSLGFYRMKQVH